MQQHIDTWLKNITGSTREQAFPTTLDGDFATLDHLISLGHDQY